MKNNIRKAVSEGKHKGLLLKAAKVKMGNVKNSVEKAYPNNADAEKAVLGAMLLDPSAISDVVSILKEADFYVPAHSIVFDAILSLYEENKPIDLITVGEFLLNQGRLDDIGGSAYLSEILAAVPTAANIESHADIVKKKAILRHLIAVGTDIVQRAYSCEEEPDELLDTAEQKVFEIAKNKDSSSMIHINELVHNNFDFMSQLHQHDRVITGLPTGLDDIDELTSGLQKAELIILAARPSMGKSALASCIMEHVALKEGKGVVFFSLEMTRDNLVQRLLCSQSKISFHALRKGFVEERGFEALTVAAKCLSEAKIYIDDASDVSVLDIKNKARRLCAAGEIDLIVIDYLQLIMMRKRVENRQQEISEISRYLKNLARELKVPVLVLSQLNRSAEVRPDKRPMLSDLRESGSIEQDADMVMLLFREEYYKPTDENRNLAELILAKNRNGPTGAVPLTFFKEYTRFENHAGRDI